MVITTIETESEPETDIGGHSQIQIQTRQHAHPHPNHQQIHFAASEKVHHGHHGARDISIQGLNIPGREFVPTHHEPIAEEQEVKYPEPTWKASFTNTLKANPIVLAIPILLPISWALHFSNQSPVVVFVSSLLCIVPLAGGLSFATEELALRLGDSWGGLLNATFGNAVELLIAILALVKGEIDIVQASMVGSILSNILLVLGMSYFAGGLRFHEQIYGVVGAQMHISLLGISIMAFALPAAYHYAYPATYTVIEGETLQNTNGVPQGEELDNLLKMSRGLSFILLLVYGMFLCFQLWTHAYLFRIPKEKATHPLPGPIPNHEQVFPRPNWVPSIADSDSTSSHSDNHSTTSTSSSPFSRFRRWSTRRPSPPDLEGQVVTPPAPTRVVDPHAPKVKVVFAVGMLTFMTALAGVTAEWLVSSIDGLTETGNVSREFVGLILLPVIGNSVEHITAVTVSVKDKLNLSMSIAVGSSIQVSLAILPILVLVGWAIGQPMTLFFDTFETISLIVAVLLVNFAISDGRTNYLEGFVMMMAWVCIAIVCWFYDPIS